MIDGHPGDGLRQWWPAESDTAPVLVVAEPVSALDVAVGRLPDVDPVGADRHGLPTPRHAARRRPRSMVPGTALPAPRPEPAPSYEPLGAVVLQLLVSTGSTDELLGGLVEVALQRVPRCDEVSLAVVREGSPMLIAASGDAVRRVTEAQFRQGRGPCPAAAATGRVTVVDDVSRIPGDESWGAIAEEYGIAAMMAVPLRTPGGAVGTLSLHSRSGPGWPPETALAGNALAGYAAQALTVAHRLDAAGR